MAKRDIPYYQDFISDDLLRQLEREGQPVAGVPGLAQIGPGGGLETTESLRFVCDLYDQVGGALAKVLAQRIIDRQFIDKRTRACLELNKKLGIEFSQSDYVTILGQKDASGRTVIGPKTAYFHRRGGGRPIAALPDYLKGDHVTLFGPPDDAKLSINAMNAFHRKIKNEPPIISELLKGYSGSPKWGADDEDSKTPLRQDLIEAGQNLSGCFDGSLHFIDPITKKAYALEKDRLSLPIKRFPGLALPCPFLIYRGNPLPLHLYDFALHVFRNWNHEAALSFYVPKLETEEEAAYIHLMVETTEKLIQQRHPDYRLGSIRLFIVLENPRAIFRANEIMDALHPYFAGASLGWHDYLASTARLFKEDSNYRIPVKADPNIVIKYIKASHELLAEVVGSRGGIKIGGMYGVLPMSDDLNSESFQVTMKGFVKDVITQMKRDLSGFWVAHPDFVRIGLALVAGWKLYRQGDKSKLQSLIGALLNQKYRDEVLAFIDGPDVAGLDRDSPLYPRALLVADVKASSFIANNDSEEIRYNVFQSIQYLADWLTGNGCVALPALIDDIPVRVMDDLATAERSRWEVWHEIHHGRFQLEEFLRIAHEEMTFIRKNLSEAGKSVQVKWDERNEKWYGVAFHLMLQLMTATKPVEFASELLLPFTVESIRNAVDPWAAARAIDPKKYALDPYIQRFNLYFSACGSVTFAKTMAARIAPDFQLAKRQIDSFSLSDVVQTAWFHGDIGESKETLDGVAEKEQALVASEDSEVKTKLKQLGDQYFNKFGVKFLISAQGKSGKEILTNLETRLRNTLDQELANAKGALFEITVKRLNATITSDLLKKIDASRLKHGVTGATISVSAPSNLPHVMCFGERIPGREPVTEKTWFELASLSKTLACAFAVEYFKSKGIPLETSVNAILGKTSSSFRMKSLNDSHPEWADAVTIEHLMSHTALNMHYVNGVPVTKPMPNVWEYLNGPVGVMNAPGTRFQYSGGGFLVLEHLLEALEEKSISALTQAFFDGLGTQNLSFVQTTLPNTEYANGYLAGGELVDGSRKMFPAFAAGGMGTAGDFSQFLEHLAKAYHCIDGSGPISHDTAVRMLHGEDKGSGAFMGAKMGLGVFTAVAGQNRFAIHQGANDGFRCLYVHCYDGPDAGKGFVILCNADANGVLFVSEVAQLLFKELQIQGINAHAFKENFDRTKFRDEELVNLAYKDLIFGAFEPDLPEEIINKGTLDPLAEFNCCVGATILSVTDQRFARAENLLSPYLPKFDPELYGRQGKIMDSWETARHNPAGCDELIFKLKKPSAIRFVSVSTQFHLGNQGQSVAIEGRSDAGSWHVILPKLGLQGHANQYVESSETATIFTQIRVHLYPDGGLTRLGLYADLPEAEKIRYRSHTQAQSHPFEEQIPHATRPLTPIYEASDKTIQQNWRRLPAKGEVDVACEAYGGKIIHASNEHYGPASRVISPFPPLDMFDGFESARSRESGHCEEIVIALGQITRIHRVEIDFTFFKNNNPRELRIEGLCQRGWIELVAKTNVKAYAGNTVAFPVRAPEALEQVRITILPDGGMNRVRVLTHC